LSRSGACAAGSQREPAQRTDRSPPPCHPAGQRSTAWSAVAPVPRGRLAGRRLPSPGTSCLMTRSLAQPPPAFSLDPTDRPEQSDPPRSAFSQRWCPGTAATAFGQTLWAQRGSARPDAISSRASVWRKRFHHATPRGRDDVLGAPYAVSTLGTGSRCTRARSVLQMRPARADEHPSGPGWNRRPDVAYSTGSEEFACARRRRPRPASGAGVDEGRIDN